MAKAKKKRISDIKLKKPISEKKLNPFEVRVNRDKFKVLGKKSKFDKGLPGVSRAKAIKKRKETLFQEYIVKNKSNKFLDKRIGERNKAMTNEDKILARFTAERMKAHSKKTLFNLAEEEELTHKGRSITEAERFDDPRSGDEDEEDERKPGALDANFVNEAHFGGGTLSKSKNSRESVIDQLIADSKKRKIERQQTRERTLELTEKLDTEWRDLVPLVNMSDKNDEEEVPNKGRGDPFDITLRELKFEARGKPSDKLKTEEEIAEQEAERLAKLEEERLKRMKGEDTVVTVTKKQHRSADALDDNFEVDDQDDFELMYDQDGNIVSRKITDDNVEYDEPVILKPNTDDFDESDDEEDNDDVEEDNDNDEESNDDIHDLKNELELCDQENCESGDESNDELTTTEHKSNEKKMKTKHSIEDVNPSSFDAKSCEVLNSSGNCSLSEPKSKKRKSSESGDSQLSPALKQLSCDENTGEIKKKKKVCFDNKIEEVKFGENAPGISQNKTKNEIRDDLMKRKELMDIARKELPYTYEAPKSYEDLQGYFEGRSQNEVAVIVERIIKCNHPKLREENKLKMDNLFAFLMQYLNDLVHKNCWAMLDRLIPFLYDIMMFSPSNVAECLVEILKEKQSDFSEKKYKYPMVNTFVFLKLVPLLFPASDKRHPVTTPALVFISQMLQSCRVNNRRSVSCGLFLVSLMYEYVSLSHRICPQALNFLAGILHLASPSDVKSNVVPPFKEIHKFLYIQQPFSGEVDDLKMSPSELSSKTAKLDDLFRVKSFYVSLKLLGMYIDLYESHQAAYLLFLPFNKYLSGIQISKYPAGFNDLLKTITDKLNKLSSKQLEKITISAKKPKALRLYEPVIETVYDTKRRNNKNISAEKAERDKLLHKIKRENKGALREIRRDSSFIAKVKFKEQEKNDEERIRKVKEIMTWGVQQNTEMSLYNKLKKKRR